MCIIKSPNIEMAEAEKLRRKKLRLFEKKCRKCKCIFQYNSKEIQFHSWDWEGTDPGFVVCPGCGHEITHHKMFTKKVGYVYEKTSE